MARYNSPVILRSLSGDDPLPTYLDSADDLIARTSGLELDRLTEGSLVVLLPASGTNVLATDPYRKQTFDKAAALYALRDGQLRRTVVVHHASEDRLWAQKITRLAARLLRLHRQKFGRPARFQGGSDETHLWLFREPLGGIGGETRGGNVYFYGTARIGSPLEWVRTLCHEWGHLTLPAARGFTEPETDAGGLLGERLHLGWLLADKTSSPDDGTRSPDIAMYCRRQCLPLIERFLAEGPASPLLARRDARAMDLYIGAALATERALGSKVLDAALYSIDGTSPRDFFDALRNAVFLEKSVAVQLPAWVPLAPGDYRIVARSGRGALSIAGRSPIPLPGTLRPARPAFAKLTGTGTLTQVALTRPGVKE